MYKRFSSSLTAIKALIDENQVLLFMKGTPAQPQCGFSSALVQVLKLHKVPFRAINVLEDQNLRAEIKKYSNWPTIPQLYVNNEFIGGCDVVLEMHKKGELKNLFQDVK